MKQSGYGGSSNSLWTDISKGQLLDRLLFIIKPVVEYAFGMHIGFLLGWLIGLGVGHSYVEHFEPAYLEDLHQLSFWTTAPCMFARYAALAGMTIGVIVIGIINSKLLNQIVTSLCENKTTNPYKIARLLGKSVARIERIMNTLVKKGRISRKVNSH
jgi:hypothetical protein